MHFPWSRPTLASSGLLRGFTDWHCHLLPGVDDGVAEMEETLRILAIYEQQGVARVWLTPHIMEDVPNRPADLRHRYEELQEAYTGPIELHLAAENMLDSLFAERLKAADVLPLGVQGDRLLVETSYFSAPAGFAGLLDDVRRAGYFPVLAHPERYVYMEPDDYRRLKDQGVLFQLNLFSLFGFYGPPAKKKAQRLLKKGDYNLMATDLHRQAVLQQALTCRLSQQEWKNLEAIKEAQAE